MRRPGLRLLLFAGFVAIASTGTAVATSVPAYGVGAPPPPTGNAPTPQWSFVPLSASPNFLTRSAIHLEAGPGQTVADTAVLTNYSDVPLNFEIYSADAYNTKKLGAYALKLDNAPKVGVGSWIQLPVNVYTVPPRTQTEFHFSVTVPSNAAPGDYAGGVAALNTITPGQQASGESVAVQRGEGIAVYVRVPGPLRPGLAASGISADTSVPVLAWANGDSSASTSFTIVNTGNVVLSGRAQLQAVDLFGGVVHSWSPVAFTALIPGQSAEFTEPTWNSLPIIGPIKLRVTMTAPGVHTTDQSTFWILPWLLILIVVLLVALVVFLWWRRRRRRKVAAAAAPAPEPEQPPARVG